MWLEYVSSGESSRVREAQEATEGRTLLGVAWAGLRA